MNKVSIHKQNLAQIVKDKKKAEDAKKAEAVAAAVAAAAAAEKQTIPDDIKTKDEKDEAAAAEAAAAEAAQDEDKSKDMYEAKPWNLGLADMLSNATNYFSGVDSDGIAKTDVYEATGNIIVSHEKSKSVDEINNSLNEPLHKLYVDSDNDKDVKSMEYTFPETNEVSRQ